MLGGQHLGQRLVEVYLPRWTKRSGVVAVTILVADSTANRVDSVTGTPCPRCAMPPA